MSMTQHVGIFDYGAGNLKSLHNALTYTGASVSVITKSEPIDHISHLVFPGVGAFGYCRDQLAESGMLDLVLDTLERQLVPVLGICVGMQLLADSSTEFGNSAGLGVCGGVVSKIPATSEERVPHVGWNEVEFHNAFGGFSTGEKVDFYFDHSYALTNPKQETVLGTTTHSIQFTSLVKTGMVVGAQFHPEKSQNAGLLFLNSFLNMTE